MCQSDINTDDLIYTDLENVHLNLVGNDISNLEKSPPKPKISDNEPSGSALPKNHPKNLPLIPLDAMVGYGTGDKKI